MTTIQYREVTAKRAVDGTNFPRGVIDFEFSAGIPTAWIPNKSYFQLEMTITGAAAASQPLVTEQICFATNACAAAFDNIYFRAGGQDVSSIVQYAAQAHQVKNRITKSGAWLNQIGSEALLQESNFQKRVNYVSRGAAPELSEEVKYVNLSDQTNPLLYGTADLTLTGGNLVGTNGTAFKTNGVKKGDTLVLLGQRFTVQSVADDDNLVVLPAAAAPLVGKTDVNYVIQQNPATGSQKNHIFALYQPPVGIFDHAGALGSGQYRFQLNPNADYKKAMVQSVRNAAITTDFDIVINDIKLYIATVKVDVGNSVETLHLNEMQVQQKAMGGDNTTLHFTVPPSTSMLSIWVQDGAAGADVRVPPTSFKMIDGSQNNLQSLQITYDNTSRPSTRWSSAFSTSTAINPINTLQHRYMETMHESELVLSAGGGQSFGQWMEDGPLITYAFPRDKDSLSTEVQLQIAYSVLGPNARIFLCAHYRKSTRITTSNGMVVEVESLMR
jgi:hypothetical protein